MITRPYGVGALFKIAPLDGAGSPPGLTFAAATLVAGDLKLSTDLQTLTNLTAEFASFTSGSVAPSVGDTISGQTNSQTAVVIGYKLTSGTWAGGDAAGTIFVEQVSGAWTAELVDNDTTSSTNDFTLSADFTPSIGGLGIGDEIWFACTSTEMSCKQGMVMIEDQGANVWAADGVSFETYGNAAALHPVAEVDLVDAPNTTAIAAFFATALTEAYSTDGSTATAANLLYETVALLSEFSVSGTTVTVKKRDGSTTAMTLTLNSATNPSSTTRAS